MTIKIKFGPDNQVPPVIQTPLPPRTEKVHSSINDMVGIGRLRKTNPSSMDKEKDRDKEKDKDKEKVAEILAELESFIGLVIVKRLIRDLQAFVEIQRRRSQEKLIAEPLVLHMIFKGNPGTGKTTVARIVGRLFKEMGVLQKGHIIECERADLVGEYIGHTAQKTRDQLKKALGGVLFIDEAYSLARGGEKDFGKEAIDALVKAMEDNKDNLVLILAGYSQEMDWFLQTNPGLRSRFPIHIDFPDYTIEELLAIGKMMFKFRQYELTLAAEDTLRFHLQTLLSSHRYAGNARLVRNLVEKTIRQQAVRLFQKPSSSREELIQILPIDINMDNL
ncbi:AAA family ATPase [Desulfosporosinus hippei]|uniref:Stage V sporulation protein K n=1 Tax=Desulfosporosinus hippei DSM 8344 TaxID=1121419 RepID=A0A1G7ZWC2_9FIRM|nr:AAA family ATPase [Desulfosporosinus hippei]SDH12897.1 stage V sporulation protein K [Desulfosporosinus hippei DSM 8344]